MTPVGSPTASAQAQRAAAAISPELIKIDDASAAVTPRGQRSGAAWRAIAKMLRQTFQDLEITGKGPYKHMALNKHE